MSTALASRWLVDGLRRDFPIMEYPQKFPGLIAPAECGPHSTSERYDPVEHWWRPAAGIDDASYASLGVEMKGDALLVKGDLLKVHQNLPRSDENNAARDETHVGGARVAPKEKEKKREEQPLPSCIGEWSHTQPS